MFQKDKIKIGIAGVGYVGGAVRSWFEKENYALFVYDKYKKIGSIYDLNKADIIFMCLPTPFFEENGKGFDDSAILEVLEKIEGEKIIVIKSTVVPGSTERYQKKYSQHKFLMNPEFLRAKTPVEDYLKPERQIVGYTEISKDVAKDVLSILSKAPFEEIVKATEAEVIKYFGNMFLANRIIFANQIYDVCQKLDIDYKAIKKCVGADSRIGQSHFDVVCDGGRGYGGACLPKDIKAFIQFTDGIGMDLELLKCLEKINGDLFDKNGKKK